MRTHTLNRTTAPLRPLYALACGLAFASAAVGGEYDKYAWETPRSSGIDAARTAWMVDALVEEVDRILQAGPLAPLRTAYADIPYEAYWSYFERGRLIGTLAWAYPHVPKAQQDGIRRCVRDLLQDPERAPWTPGILQRDQGAERAVHGDRVSEGRYFEYDPRKTPTVHVLYGLWLYGDRTGDWETLEPYWPQISAYYKKAAPLETRLYGQMSAHVAMARMARRFGDSALESIAVRALEADLAAGRASDAIEERQKQTRFAVYYSDRNRSSFPGQPWMYLDACPEVLRFIADTGRQQALDRIDAFQERFPLWWLAQSPYFTRWTGDEGVGAPPDLFGMCYPVERWVRGAPPEQLADYVRSMPTGIGDCYWIEGLVQTIEAFGTVTWEPVP